MNKEQAQQHIESCLQESDSFIGFFQAIEPPKIWLFFLIGPLAVFSMKSYFLAVTEAGIYFHKLSLLGKFNGYDFFTYDDIENVKIGKGLLQRPIKFKFKNNRKITVKAQLKGVEKIAKITPEVQQYIEGNIPVIS
ncbi:MULTISPECIES: PH domain-containing protein [unclassified Agarivorans]|uniref:PH domain-containing protein n=1 Tax=unclassified Agarivorans TaxID=2636026 RepID=UPI003D7DCDC6